MSSYEEFVHEPISADLISAGQPLAWTSAASFEIGRARARLATLSARLDSLSPLAVLARGYAVCWNAERTEIIRQAAVVSPGDRVRVTLQEGELDCEVKGRE